MNFSSTLGLALENPLDREEIKKLKAMIQNLNDNPDSTEFRVPVDWRGTPL